MQEDFPTNDYSTVFNHDIVNYFYMVIYDHV